ncbi:alpha/beta hydrolase family protein [Rossellomorea sp. DUT-2]|uniref:alpha/beta hydrolase family protein n=1 Tax=Rossellomorea sp. DUT-2 TaxID=3412021 RepID=UPI003D17196F
MTLQQEKLVNLITEEKIEYFTYENQSKVLFFLTNRNGIYHLYSQKQSNGSFSDGELLLSLENKCLSILPLSTEELLLLMDEKGKENNLLYHFNITNKELKQFKGREMSNIYFPQVSKDGSTLIFSSNVVNQQYFNTYQYHFKNEALQLLHEGYGYPTHIYDISPDEKKFLYFKHINNSRCLPYLKVDDEWQDIFSCEEEDSFTVFDTAFISNNELLLVTNYREEYAYLAIYNMNEQSLKTLFKLQNENIRMLDIDKVTNELIFSTTTGTRDYIYRYNILTKKYRKMSEDISIVEGFSMNHGALIVMGSSANHTTNLFLLSDNKYLNLTNYENETYVEASIERLKYTSLDGLEIEGLLHQPKDKSGKLLIWIHGGPNHSEKEFTKEPHFKLFLKEGYSIFCPNYRGSSGYGKEFLELGKKNWIEGALADIVMGFKYLQDFYSFDKPIIMGRSFGGYLAQMLIIKYQEIGKGCISVCGPTDLERYILDAPQHWREMLIDFIGDPIKEIGKLKMNSPIYHINKIKKPVLIFHGKNDPRVKINQSEILVNKLKKYNKKFDYFFFENEGHSIVSLENQAKYLEKINSFIAECEEISQVNSLQESGL